MTRSLSRSILTVSKIGAMGKPISHKHILGNYGRKMQKVRQAKGITQEELASTLSLYRTYIGLIELGKRNPTIRALYKISKSLIVKASDLLPL